MVGGVITEQCRQKHRSINLNNSVAAQEIKDDQVRASEEILDWLLLLGDQQEKKVPPVQQIHLYCHLWVRLNS